VPTHNEKDEITALLNRVERDAEARHVLVELYRTQLRQDRVDLRLQLHFDAAMRQVFMSDNPAAAFAELLGRRKRGPKSTMRDRNFMVAALVQWHRREGYSRLHANGEVAENIIPEIVPRIELKGDPHDGSRPRITTSRKAIRTR
jgi:hypothetical protein